MVVTVHPDGGPPDRGTDGTGGRCQTAQMVQGGTGGPRLANERTRVMTAAAVGAVAGVAVAWFVPWQLSVLVAWDVTVVVLVVWIWVTLWPLDATDREGGDGRDNSRQSTSILLVSTSVASLVGVALAVIKAKTQPAHVDALMTTVGVLTVVLSWALVHTLFALRYAHLYYSDHPGGIDFKNDAPPDFLDFAYVAFTVGMTFQVSDTDVQLRAIRRTILRQALLAYVFGTVIIALTINVVAGFVR